MHFLSLFEKVSPFCSDREKLGDARNLDRRNLDRLLGYSCFVFLIQDSGPVVSNGYSKKLNFLALVPACSF